jgi:hypothetical protein
MAAVKEGVGADDLAEARDRLRNALEPNGILLIHDTTLPCATAAIAGDTVRGSWWGHPKGNLIYATLEDLGNDVDCFKLMKGKDTLLSRRLWPALLSIGLSRQSWQLVGLGPAGKWVWEQALARGHTSQRELAEAKTIPGLGAVMTDLQKRLLLYGHSEHTEAGVHKKTLQSWPAWQEARHVATNDVPSTDAAIAMFRAAVRAFGPEAEGFFPWAKAAAPRAPARGKRAPSRG